jgi:calcineurin-like phosphoesterase family protein
MRYFTSDTHFGDDAETIMAREMRPFSSKEEYRDYQIKIWNKQATKDDTIYHLGDFCNYNEKEHIWLKNGLELVQKVNANVVLIIGNNEERVINNEFNGSFNNFQKFCLELGFKEVFTGMFLTINGTRYYLNHYPRNHKNTCENLFGHVHRLSGIYRNYGFNVCTDINHYRLLSEIDIDGLREERNKYFYKDKRNYEDRY